MPFPSLSTQTISCNTHACMLYRAGITLTLGSAWLREWVLNTCIVPELTCIFNTDINDLIIESTLSLPHIVIPAAILSGNPASVLLNSGSPDRKIRRWRSVVCSDNYVTINNPRSTGIWSSSKQRILLKSDMRHTSLWPQSWTAWAMVYIVR